MGARLTISGVSGVCAADGFPPGSRRRQQGGIRLRLLCAGAVLVLLLLSIGAAVVRWHHTKVREQLFAGPAELVKADFPGYVTRPEVDMSAYEGIDALTSASVIARLSTPSTYRERRPYKALTITYPPDGAVFPPNLCEPRVEWEDPANDLWQVSVGREGRDPLHREVVSERLWWFPDDLWRQLKSQGAGRTFTIQVRGVRQSDDQHRVQASEHIRFSFSQYPADNYVVARQVGVPFDIQRAPDTYIRDIRSFQQKPFLLAREQYCFNCHTFSSKSGTTGKLAYQARYLGPESFDLRTYLAIYDFDRGKGWRVKLPYDVQMTTFCAWSPDGTKLALSANQYIIAAQPITLETQMAGENTSDIAIYDINQGTTWLLPGADREDWLEIHPEWTPDGKALIFASAPPGHHPAFVPFDLAIIPYNDGNGGEPTLIPGASANGRSNYYPRFSPDGRWLAFNQCDGGDLIRSSSDIYLMPASLDGPVRALESNVPFAADSWHSWSSNSRWILFASKREDGTYARLYMTEIDDEGHASPAVRLPERTDILKSYNIPEFVARVPPIPEEELYEAIRVEQPPRAIAGKQTTASSD